MIPIPCALPLRCELVPMVKKCELSDPYCHTKRLLGDIVHVSDALHSPVLSTSPTTEQMQSPPSTGSPLNELATSPERSAVTSAQVSSGEVSRPAATKRPAATQAQIPVLDTSLQVQPNTSIPEPSEPARNHQSSNRKRTSNRAFTSEMPLEFNSVDLKGLVESANRGVGDGLTINVGGRENAGAYINKTPMMHFYAKSPAA
ncbi:hypothetical protein J3A83DRAFT_2611861 [Scleroderma citrinum]